MTNPTAASRIARPGGRLDVLATSLFLMPIAVLGVAVFSLVITGIGLTTLWIGVPIASVLIYFTRHLADLHRLWFGSRFGVRITRPYRRLPEGHFRRFLALLSDPQTWRDQAWLLVNGSLGVAIMSTIVSSFAAGLGALSLGLWWELLPDGAEFNALGIPGFMNVHDSSSAFAFGIPAGITYLAVWWYLAPPLMRGYALITRALLGDREPRLAQRVDHLAEVLAN